MPDYPIFYDKAVLTSSRQRTEEGYLLADAQFARVGIQEYSVGELVGFGIGVPESLLGDSNRVVKILRSETEVFNDASMQSFARKPVTNEHPSDFVNSKNFRNVQVGLTGDTVTRIQDALQTRIIVQDSETIALIEQGKQQLSAGYTAPIIWESGNSEYGVYDGKQTNIRGNHVAIVDRGRAGADIRIFDRSRKEKNMGDEKIIDRLTLDLDKAREDLNKANKTIDALTGKVDGLTKAIETQKKEHENILNTAIKAHLQCVYDAKKLDPNMDVLDKTTSEIRTEVLAKFLDTDLTGRSDEYLQAAFEVLVAQRKPIADTAGAISKDLKNSTDSPFTDIRNNFLNRHNQAVGVGGK